MTDLTKWKIYTQDLSDAKTQFNGMNDSPGNFINGMGEVASSQDLATVAGHPFSGGAATAWPTSDAAQLYKKMQGLAGTAKDIGSRGGPKGVGQNLTTLGCELRRLHRSELSPTTTTMSSRHACGRRSPRRPTPTARRAGQRYAGLPSALPRPQYQPGGDLDPGVGFKPYTKNKNLKPVDAEAMAAIQRRPCALWAADCAEEL